MLEGISFLDTAASPATTTNARNDSPLTQEVDLAGDHPVQVAKAAASPNECLAAEAAVSAAFLSYSKCEPPLRTGRSIGPMPSLSARQRKLRDEPSVRRQPTRASEHDEPSLHDRASCLAERRPC